MDFPKAVLCFSIALVSMGCLFHGGSMRYAHRLPVISPNTVYSHQLIDLNGLPTQLGESNENGVRNGKWKWYDHHHRVIRIETYSNDTLHGQSRSYRHENSEAPTCTEGVYAKGVQVGEWLEWRGKGAIREEGEGRWQKTGKFYCDAKGRKRIRHYLHPNEQVAVELHMSLEGQDTHFRRYSPKGALIDEGDSLPIIIR